MMDASSHVLLASKTLVPAAAGRLIHSATLAFNGSSYGVAFSADDYRSSRTWHLYYPYALEVSRSLDATPLVALSNEPQADERVDIVPAGSDFAVLWHGSDYGTIRSATIAEHREQAFLRGDAKQFPLTAASSVNVTLGVWQELDGPEVRLRCAPVGRRHTALTLAAGTGVRYVAKAASDGSGFLVVWTAIPVSLLPDAPPAPASTAAAYLDRGGAAHPIELAPDDRHRIVDAVRFNGGYHVAVRDALYSSAISLTSGGFLEKTITAFLPGSDRVLFDGVHLLAATHSQLTITSTSTTGGNARTLPAVAPAVDLKFWWPDGIFVLQRSGSAVTAERFTPDGTFLRFHDVVVPPNPTVELVRVADGFFLAAAAPDGPLTLTALDIETLQPGAAFTFEHGVAAEDDLLLESTPVPGDLGGSARMTVRSLGMTRRTRASRF
jgi:hypothetical protein